MLSKRLAVCIAGLLVAGSVSAQVPNPKDLLIEGEKVVYDHNYANVDATGNVVIAYQGTTLNTSVFKYSLQKKRIKIPGSFTISRDDQEVKAEKFDYNMSTYSGTAENLFSKAGRLTIKGETLTLEKERWILKNAEFTTCDDPNPHYLVRSKTLIVYPQFGFFVAFDNDIKTQVLPFGIWVPTYVYGNSAYSLLGTSTPLPTIGSSPREGAYIKGKIPYFISPQSTGTVDLGYLGASGLMFGATHHQGLSPAELLEVSLHSLGNDGWDGGVRYFLNFSPIEPPTKNAGSDPARMSWMKSLLTKFNTFEQQPLKNLILSMTWGELINDSRVDKKPFAEVAIRQRPIFDTGFFLNLQVKGGLLGESNSSRQYLQKWTLNTETEIERRFALTSTIEGQTSLVHDSRFYDNADTWQRVWLKVGGTWKTVFNPNVWIVKRILKYGSSPFEFERKYAVEDDELGLRFSQVFSGFEIFGESRYALEQRVLVTADMGIGFSQHCWKTFFRWNTLNGQFMLGVEVY